jgi:hypothetical protein
MDARLISILIIIIVVLVAPFVLRLKHAAPECANHHPRITALLIHAKMEAVACLEPMDILAIVLEGFQEQIVKLLPRLLTRAAAPVVWEIIVILRALAVLA